MGVSEEMQGGWKGTGSDVAPATKSIARLRGFPVIILRARKPHCFLCLIVPLKFGSISGSQVGLGHVHANSRTACYTLSPDELGNCHLIVLLRHSNSPANSRLAMTAGGSLTNSQRAGRFLSMDSISSENSGRQVQGRCGRFLSLGASAVVRHLGNRRRIASGADVML